jgi:hypothetical protein
VTRDWKSGSRVKRSSRERKRSLGVLKGDSRSYMKELGRDQIIG